MRTAAVAVPVVAAVAAPAAAALLPALGERAVVPGTPFSSTVEAGEAGASLYVERAPVGVELVPDGPGRWTLRWDVPSRIRDRTVVRLGAVDVRDRTRRESGELVLVSGAAPVAPVRSTAPIAPVAPAAPTSPAAADAPSAAPDVGLPEVPPRTLVAGRDWRLRVPVRGGTPRRPSAATLELRGAPAGLTATPAGDGWYALRWRPGPSVTGSWTVELIAVDSADPSLRSRRRLVLEVRPPAGAAPRELVEVPAAMRDAPRLRTLPNHVVNPGQDVAFRVETLGEGVARVDIDRLPRGARFDANDDGSRTFYWPTSDRDHGEHRFRFTATDPNDPSLTDSVDVLVIVGDPSRGRTVPAGDPLPGTPVR